MGIGTSTSPTFPGLNNQFLTALPRQHELARGHSFGRQRASSLFDKQPDCGQSQEIWRDHVPYFNSSQQFQECHDPEAIGVENLKKLFGLTVRPATARLVIRGRPVGTEERPWTTIDYSFNRASGQEVLDIYGEGGLDNLLPRDAQIGNAAGYLMKDIQMATFFNQIDYFMNNLEGIIWWNGFIINLSGPPNARLQVVDLEMDPLRLIFNVSNFKTLDVVRTSKRFELIGQTSGHNSVTFKIQGLNTSKINFAIPKDGTIVLNFPPYYAGMD